MQQQTSTGTTGGLVLLIIVVVYFLPTLVAIVRSKRNTNAIGVLNLLLGWTFVGWVDGLLSGVAVDAALRSQDAETLVNRAEVPRCLLVCLLRARPE
jgi:hypothetical protein